MNNTRRKEIDRISCEIEGLREQLGGLLEELQEVIDEEDEARENIPENLRESERYLMSEIASASMEEARSNIEGALITIDFVPDYLNEAIE